MKLQSRNLEPLTITPVDQVLGKAQVRPPLVRESGGDRHAASPAGLSARNFVPIVLSSLALIVSVGALALSLLRDPLGPGLEKYDFSTPEAALTSMARMQQDHGIRALMELDALRGQSEIEQGLKTCKIEKKVTEESRAILFVSYEIDGKRKQECEVFEKHAQTGYWLPTYISSYSIEDEDPGLATQMREWEDADLAREMQALEDKGE